MLPRPASTATQKVRPMYKRPMPGSTGPMMINSAPASAHVAVAMPNAHCLMRTGIGAHQRQRRIVLRNRSDSASRERGGQINRQPNRQQQRYAEGNQHAHRQSHFSERQAAPDVRRLHHALIDAEREDQSNFQNEGDAEKERQPAQASVGAAPLEHRVIEAVHRKPDHEEYRRQQRAGEQRIDAITGRADTRHTRRARETPDARCAAHRATRTQPTSRCSPRHRSSPSRTPAINASTRSSVIDRSVGKKGCAGASTCALR